MSSPSRHVLIVEDDDDLARLARVHLEGEGYGVSVAADGDAGAEALEGERFDLVVLDLGLPGVDGLELCRRIRRADDYTPIVMLTARGTELDRVLGLEIGADDYLVKPVSFRELVARVRALFRRVDALRAPAPASLERLEHGALVLEPERRRATVAGVALDLTAKEFDLLEHFLRQPGVVSTRSQLLEEVWGAAYAGYEHTVNSHINRLRAKLGPERGAIETVWGVGYRLRELAEGERVTSLHWKLAAVFAALLSLVTLSVLVLCLRSAERYGAEVRQELNREVAPQIAKDLQPFSDEELDKDALKSVFMKVMVVNPALEVYLLDDAGRVLAYDAPPEKVVRSAVDLAPVLRLLADPEGGLIEGDDPRNRTARKPFTAAAIEDEHGLRGYLYMIVGGEEYDSVAALLKQSHILRVLAWSAGGMLAMGLVAGALAFGWLTRPLRRLRVAMASFREGRPVPALHIESRDEIGALARTFEHLTRRISEHVDRLDRVDRERREFVANVSHDLRTPLASLQGYLDLLRDKSVELAPAQREEFVENARGRARHLERLIDQLFELARFDAGDVPVSLEEFQLAELVQDVLQENRIRAGARGVRLRCRMPHDLPVVVGDIGLIERALGNLLDNATRHTPRGGDVTVRLRTLADRVEVRVSDTGSGIPREEIDKVFDRTYQVDRSSQRGTGLGLAITRRILELHDAVIRVRSRVDEGTTFRFALPTA